MPEADSPQPDGQLLIYSDGSTKLQVRIEGQTVWLTQGQMAELFQTTPQNITIHLKSVYDDGELDAEATCKDYLQVRQEGQRQVKRALKHYSLEAIIAVGYRVRSGRGTAFRQWATAQLSELLVKGFVIDDDRVKEGQSIGADYFDELLERIRDIRASERRTSHDTTSTIKQSEAAHRWLYLSEIGMSYAQFVNPAPTHSLGADNLFIYKLEDVVSPKPHHHRSEPLPVHAAFEDF